LNNEKDTVHELQVEDTLKDDELSEVLGGTGGQAGSSQSEQEPVTPVVLATQVRPVCSIGQTGSAKQVRPVPQTGQTGSDQGRSEKLKSKRSKINSSKDRCEHKGKKSKLSFNELLAKYLKENEAKCANRSNVDKSSKMPPK
jgi:hypothetical protein